MNPNVLFPLIFVAGIQAAHAQSFPDGAVAGTAAELTQRLAGKTFAVKRDSGEIVRFVAQ